MIEDSWETRLYYVGAEDAMGAYIGFWDDYPYTTSCHGQEKRGGNLDNRTKR